MLKSIAIYPCLDYKDRIQQWKDYLELAQRHGFNEVFTSVHLPEMTLVDQLNSLQALSELLLEFDMKLTVDIGGKYIKEVLNNEDHIATLNGCHINFIRLDYGYDHLDVERLYESVKIDGFVVNASIYKQAEIDQEIQFLKSLDQDILIKACHNFYPCPETGLDKAFALSQQRYFASKDILVYYCVPSQKYPRGPLFIGLPTIEAHRYTSISSVIIDLINNYACQAILLADVLYTSYDFEQIDAILNFKPLIIPIVFNEKATDIEKSLVLKTHQFRYDSNVSLLRSKTSRVMASFEMDVTPNNCIERPCGSIIILNTNSARYSGEMQVILQDRQASSYGNVVGKIDAYGLELLAYHRFGYVYQFEELK